MSDRLRLQGFLKTGCDETRSAPSALHCVPRCLQSALPRRPYLRFGPEKLLNSTLFATEGNDTLELIGIILFHDHPKEGRFFFHSMFFEV